MTKAERTRQFIVEKTAPIFNMKGFAGTSLSDLTDATGLTKGSIYGNFANKDEVALAVFDYNVGRMNQGIKEAADSKTNAVEKLLKMADFHRCQFKTTAGRGGCPVLNTAIDSDDTHPQLKEKVAKSIKNWKKLIEKIISQGVAKQEVNPGVNPAHFATEYISLIEGGIMLAKATGDMNMLQIAIARVEKIIKTELTP